MFTRLLLYLAGNAADVPVGIVDEVLLRRLSTLGLDLKRSNWFKQNWSLARQLFETVFTIIADQQIVTGVIMMCIGLGQRYTISEYHFEIVTNMGWLSFATLVACASIVFRKLEASPHGSTYWRYAFYTALFALLAAYTILGGGEAFMWWPLYGWPAQCGFQDVWDGHIWKLTWVYLVLLAWNFVDLTVTLMYALHCSIVQHFPGSKYVRKPLDWLLKVVLYIGDKAVSDPTKPFEWLSNGVLGIVELSLLSVYFVVLVLYKVILQSEIFFILQNIMATALSMYEIFLYRSHAVEYGQQGSENTWAFGQILPLALLSLPLSAIVDKVLDVLHDAKHNHGVLPPRPPATSTSPQLGSTNLPSNGSKMTYQGLVRWLGQHHFNVSTPSTTTVDQWLCQTVWFELASVVVILAYIGFSSWLVSLNDPTF